MVWYVIKDERLVNADVGFFNVVAAGLPSP
jgi:hypothetical protein